MPEGETHFQGRVVQATRETDLVDADIAISAGWGTTATKSVVRGKDGRMRLQVASSGTGQVADPTITVTFKKAFTAIPVAVCSRGDVAAAAGDLRNSTPSASAPIFTFKGTPVAGQTYIFDIIVVPNG
jgi:hypothetical protein